MTISVIINGAKGRMGQQAVQAISADNELELVAALSRGDDLNQHIKNTQADVVVELTDASAVFANAQTIIKAGARPVIGASGLTAAQITTLQQQCQSLNRGGIIAPNFSIGVILMMRFAQQAAQYLPNVEIIEMHHDGKLDAPSGTAIKTANMIQQAQANINNKQTQEQELYANARGARVDNIPIHAIRLPGLLAHQEVIFGGHDETLTLRHDSLSRQCFMPGILLSCKKVMTLNELIYGLENVL